MNPDNQYAVNYMWGTTGIGYNVKAARQILGADAAAGALLDSWDDVFDPARLAKFKDCGIHMLDLSDDIMPAALHYLHLDPNSSDPADLQKAADLLAEIRPSVRKFHSSEYLNALATGEICFAVGFSGDIKQAQKRAAQGKGGSRSVTRFRRRARSCGSTTSPFRPTLRTPPRRMSLSIICCGPTSQRKIPISFRTPTAIWRARNSSTNRSSTIARSILTPRPWRNSTPSPRTIRKRSG